MLPVLPDTHGALRKWPSRLARVASRGLCLLAVIATTMTGHLRAQAPAAGQSGAELNAPTTPPEDMGNLVAPVGSAITMGWPDASVRVAVGDENLARLNVLSRREVVITGIQPGRTTVFVWLASGRRLLYHLVVEPDLETARTALRAINRALVLELGSDGSTAILRGEVANEAAARQARTVAEQLMPRTGEQGQHMTLVSLVRYGGTFGTADDRLTAALNAIDSRIRARAIQAGPAPDAAKDSYVLEGRVKDVNSLVQAIIIADRQLGGTGKVVKAADDERVAFTRSATNSMALAGMGGGGGAGGSALMGLMGSSPPKSGIAAQVARGLLLTSESGRVVSFLEVDSLPQVNVAIRVLEIDRSKAQRMGVNLRFDSNNLSIGSFVIPGAQSGVSGVAVGGSTGVGSAGTIAGGGAGRNVVASYVSGTKAVLAALDFLSERRLARSVAEPNVLTLSGEIASVLVGGQVPIPLAFANNVTVQSSFAFEQFGVRMDIRPTVDANGVVALEVVPSIITPSPQLGNGSVPGFMIQRVETTARVPAGESLVLGGLLTSDESQERRGLPGLDVLPIFRWQEKVTRNRELLFVITPRVVEAPSPDVKLPELEFAHSSNREGISGLDKDGVPFDFKTESATVLGKAGVCAEVRELPAADSPVVDCLLPGNTVFIVDSEDSRYRVRTTNGKLGWVAKSQLRVTVKTAP